MNDHHRTTMIALCASFLALAGTAPASAASNLNATAVPDEGFADSGQASSGPGSGSVAFGELCLGHDTFLDDSVELSGESDPRFRLASASMLLTGRMSGSEDEGSLLFTWDTGPACRAGDLDRCDANGQLQMACFILRNPGETTSQCSPGAFGCAQAAAHAEYEEVSGMPNVYSHVTGGHGMNPNGLSSGTTDIQTSLGSDSCSFGPGGGCGATWSDVANECKPMWAYVTVTTLGGLATTSAFDPSCS